MTEKCRSTCGSAVPATVSGQATSCKFRTHLCVCLWPPCRHLARGDDKKRQGSHFLGWHAALACGPYWRGGSTNYREALQHGLPRRVRSWKPSAVPRTSQTHCAVRTRPAGHSATLDPTPPQLSPGKSGLLLHHHRCEQPLCADRRPLAAHAAARRWRHHGMIHLPLWREGWASWAVGRRGDRGSTSTTPGKWTTTATMFKRGMSLSSMGEDEHEPRVSYRHRQTTLQRLTGEPTGRAAPVGNGAGCRADDAAGRWGTSGLRALWY